MTIGRKHGSPRVWLAPLVTVLAVAAICPSLLAAAAEQYAAPQRFEEFPAQPQAARELPQNAAPIKLDRPQAPIQLSGKKASSAKPHAAGSLWTTLGSLALVVALIYATAKLLKKHGPSVAAGVPVEALEFLGKRHLDQRQTVYLMRLGGRILVLGSSAAGLHTLAEVTDPVEVDYLAGLCRRTESGHPATAAFRSLFGSRAHADAPDGGESDRSGQAPEKMLAERLRRSPEALRTQTLEQRHG